MLYQLAQQGFRPAKYFSIDRVFRNEAVDRTHLAEFHQVEGARPRPPLGRPALGPPPPAPPSASRWRGGRWRPRRPTAAAAPRRLCPAQHRSSWGRATSRWRGSGAPARPQQQQQPRSCVRAAAPPAARPTPHPPTPNPPSPNPRVQAWCATAA
jgi:hypothetical protein